MWSRKHTECVNCGKTDKKHMGKGLCHSCYFQEYGKAKAEHLTAYRKQWWFDNHKKNLLKHKVNREKMHFDGKREIVLRRDNYRCVECGSQNKLTVHHKNGKGRGKKKPDNRLRNLETLCRSCHLAKHRAELVAARHANYDPPKLLKSGRWSKKHDACVKCKQTNSRHMGNGFCSRCYQQQHKMT